jgi:hypothetical protein
MAEKFVEDRLMLENIIPTLVEEIREAFVKKGKGSYVNPFLLSFKDYCYYQYGMFEKDVARVHSALEKLYFNLNDTDDVISKLKYSYNEIGKIDLSVLPSIDEHLQGILEDIFQKLAEGDNLEKFLAILRDTPDYQKALIELFRKLPQPRGLRLAGTLRKLYNPNTSDAKPRVMESAPFARELMCEECWETEENGLWMKNPEGNCEGVFIRNLEAFTTQLGTLFENKLGDAARNAWFGFLELVLLWLPWRQTGDFSLLAVPLLDNGPNRGALAGGGGGVTFGGQDLSDLLSHRDRFVYAVRRAFEQEFLSKLFGSKHDSWEELVKTFAKHLYLLQEVPLVSIWVKEGRGWSCRRRFCHPTDLEVELSSLGPQLEAEERKCLEKREDHGQDEPDWQEEGGVLQTAKKERPALREFVNSRLFFRLDPTHSEQMASEPPAWLILYYPDVIPRKEADRLDYRRKFILPRHNQLVAFFPPMYQQLGLNKAQKLARRKALRTAAIAIMGRNMSHNIGSHVLAKVSTIPAVSTKSMQVLLAHLQERMDFLAEVSTTKSFVSLPIWMCRDVKGPLDEQALLLQHITGVSNRKAAVALQCNGEAVSNRILTHDLQFASPGGRMGVQALYVILENIIRNSAKHGGGDSSSPVQVYLNVSTSPTGKDLYEVTVWDRYASANKLTPSLGTGKEVPVYEYLREVLEEALIDDNGEVRPRNWGMREIMICAAYLRGVELEDLEQRHEPPLLTIVPVDNDGKDITSVPNSQHANLGYRFYISLPKELMIIVSSSHIAFLDDGKRHILRQQGIDIVADPAAMEAVLGGGIEHTFFVWLNPDENAYKASQDHHSFLPLRLPLRLFVPEGTKGFAGVPSLDSNLKKRVDELLRENSLIENRSQELLLVLWQRWVEHFWSRQGSQGGLPDLRIVEDVSRWQLLVESIACSCTRDSVCSTADPSRWSQPTVVYDRHGELVHHVHDNDCLKCKVLFWEPYEADDPQYQLFTNPPAASSSKKVLKYQLLEAALTRIAILDERVQAAVEEAQPEEVGPTFRRRSMSVSAILQDMRVFVPPKQPCDLDDPTCDLDDPKLEQLRKWLCKARKQCGGFDFLVVHQGVLDKLPDRPETLVQQLAEVSGSAHVVVCSGRGIPAELPKSARFVPLSSLLKWTVRDRSKYHLCQLLFASRSPSHA